MINTLIIYNLVLNYILAVLFVDRFWSLTEVVSFSFKKLTKCYCNRLVKFPSEQAFLSN